MLDALRDLLRAEVVDETDPRSTADRRADARRKAQAVIAKATGPAREAVVI